MTGAERYDAFALMRRFTENEAALGEALSLFVERPDYGFVWLSYVDDLPVACCSVSLGIDTSAGGIVATVRDLFVVPERRRLGIGSALLITLHGRLAQLETVRIDVVGAPSLDAFLRVRGYARSGACFSRR